ncbi:MAG: SpoIIE family protein phosphatase [Bacteroidales bacterium]|nr:SpoIIE family protein phosphatase [Bacteroidales bacterium]
MARLVKILPVIFLTLSVNAQVNRFGVPVIKNYGQDVTHGSDYSWSITKDKNGVLYVATDTRGILKYDGHAWTNIAIPGDPVIRALGTAEDGTIYVGGAFEFGYLQPTLSGATEYVSISRPLYDTLSERRNDDIKISRSQIQEINSLLVTDSLVYFKSFESLFIYNPRTNKTLFVYFREHGLTQVQTIADFKGRIIIADIIKGLYELKNNVPVPLPGGENFARKICTVIQPFSERELIIATYYDKNLTGSLDDVIFKYDIVTGQTINPVTRGLNELLKGSQIYTSVLLPTGELLLGTLSEGVIVLDKDLRLTGKWDINTTDLPDQTVTSFYCGNGLSGELWAATAGFISKILINLPFTELAPRTGYEGVVNNIMEFNNDIYLATDLGIFKSTTDKDGNFAFRRLMNFNQQAFSLYQAQYENRKFLLACTMFGLYQINADGSVRNVDNELFYPDGTRRGTNSVRSVLQSGVDPSLFYMGLSKNGLTFLKYDGINWRFVKQMKDIEGTVATLIENEKGDLFIFTNPSKLMMLPKDGTTFTVFSESDGLPEGFVNGIAKVDKKILAITSRGIYSYNSETGKWNDYDELLFGYTHNMNCKDLYQDEDGDFWVSALSEKTYEMFFRRDSAHVRMIRGPLNMMPNIEKLDLKTIGNKIWIPKSKSIFLIDKGKLLQDSPKIPTLLSKITIGSDSVFMQGTFYKTLENGRRVPSKDNNNNPVPEFKYSYNSVSFFWTTPFFPDEESVTYSFRLEGFDKAWSRWEKVFYKDFTNLPYGKYTFRVRGKTITDIETEEAAFEFIILKPWYLTTLMILLYIVAFVVLIILIIKAYTRKLKNENIRLEGIVAERTAVVVKQKEELESSIHYARRIQMALLPSETILSENLKNYFILFKPRDIVSGDFYWMTKKENRLYIVAADCTGHGVPGAFMSLLGMSFLDEIIDKEKAPRADYILGELRLHVTDSLKQSGGDDEAKDGMDMALLVIDYNTNRVEFSGAYNPCFRVRKLSDEDQKKYSDSDTEMPDGSMTNGNYLLETIYASKMPIGISSRMNEDFVFYDWALEKGVAYYLFSDGYIDQFGGTNGRKFMKKNFKRLILEIQDYPMKKQKEILEERLKVWMGQMPQIDDILVMGIRTD